ncbi:Acyl-CoA-binding domain-containing protein 6 [Taenia solium]|eukprot:TsM_000606200 transcript=TsM_000606200 gene=TsM_000606200
MPNSILEDQFTRATAYVPRIAGSLSSDDLLYLYSRFKQATEGPCNTPKPGLSQYKARQKW